MIRCIEDGWIKECPICKSKTDTINYIDKVLLYCKNEQCGWFKEYCKETGEWF